MIRACTKFKCGNETGCARCREATVGGVGDYVHSVIASLPSFQHTVCVIITAIINSHKPCRRQVVLLNRMPEYLY